MVFPVITATYGAVLGLILAALSVWVIRARLTSGILHGADGDEALNRRARAHANFAEHVPLIVLLIALLEGSGASRIVINILLLILLVARVLHPLGMVAPINSRRQYMFRGGTTVATLGVLVVSAVLLLLRCITG